MGGRGGRKGGGRDGTEGVSGRGGRKGGGGDGRRGLAEGLGGGGRWGVAAIRESVSKKVRRFYIGPPIGSTIFFPILHQKLGIPF